MTKDEFTTIRKRLQRQLSERANTVNKKLKPYQHWENKRLEFVDFIDKALKTEWFIMPKETTVIYKLYHNIKG
jgi:hypothetical protein